MIYHIGAPLMTIHMLGQWVTERSLVATLTPEMWDARTRRQK